jgi:hypothetical protein
MNQDQIKRLLLQIRETEDPFQVILTGKKSRKVNGLYKQEGRQIILHNRNFATEGELLYTAIHEYAHHLHFSSPQPPRSVRSHTTRFWSLFHGLLLEAEQKGLYSSPFEEIEELAALTREIREHFIAKNGTLMKELGRLLAMAEELCEKHHLSYTDYLDRILTLPRASAGAMVNPRVGYENMRLLTRVGDPALRRRAQADLLSGNSHDMVKELIRPPPEAANPIEELRSEELRLQRTIQRLQSRLESVRQRLSELQTEASKTSHGTRRQR